MTSIPGADVKKEKYRPGMNRDPEDKWVSHLYEIGEHHMDFGLPMCPKGWNREQGSSYSIWRGQVGRKGICKTCQKRADLGLKGVDSK